MAATDSQIVIAAARWTSESSYLKEFVSKHSLPAVVKIIKGQYGGLGVPTLPSPGLQSTALLVSPGIRQKIIAQSVKIKEGRRLICVGPRLIIPDTYTGYFELLSEEGRAVRCIEGVAELARRRPEKGCLVRESIRGVKAKTDLEGEVASESPTTITPGEILVPVGETALPGLKNRYLKCLDQKGNIIFLGLDQRGKFSVLAREDNISGVHTAKNLLSKRLPLTVRLVHGTTPRGLRNLSHFVPELRLLSVIEEKHVFALPLQKDSQSLIFLPLIAPLKLLSTQNEKQLNNLQEFNRLTDKCEKLVADVIDRIHALDEKLGDLKNQYALEPAEAKNGHILRRSASSDSAHYTRKLQPRHCKDENNSPVCSKDYDEIDQIYDYVRGFAPLPKSNMTSVADLPPSPIIPSCSPLTPVSVVSKPTKAVSTKKNQSEKKNRKVVLSSKRETNSKTNAYSEKAVPSVSKLYIKNEHLQRCNVSRQKSSSPMKKTLPSTTAKSGSPLFNIRYKSLTNLQTMELDSILDSSNSGECVSAGSMEDIKQPEKRSRKLSRPKSLTNLIWKVQNSNLPIAAIEKPKKAEKATLVYKKHLEHLAKSVDQRQETLYL